MKLEVHELNQLAEQLSGRILVEVVQDRSDKLLNKKQLAEKLGCDTGELERKYLSRPGFPRLDPHVDGVRVTYSDKAVDKWISENLTIN